MGIVASTQRYCRCQRAMTPVPNQLMQPRGKNAPKGDQIISIRARLPTTTMAADIKQAGPARCQSSLSSSQLLSGHFILTAYHRTVPGQCECPEPTHLITDFAPSNERQKITPRRRCQLSGWAGPPMSSPPGFERESCRSQIDHLLPFQLVIASLESGQ